MRVQAVFLTPLYAVYATVVIRSSLERFKKFEFSWAILNLEVDQSVIEDRSVYMLQAKPLIRYRNSCFSCFVMYIWTWAWKKISSFWPGNFNKSSWSSGMEERQVRQSYREELVQISPTTEKQKKRKAGALERVVVKERGKREKEKGISRKKKWQKLKSFFINAASIHYRCIYAILWGIRHFLGRQ